MLFPLFDPLGHQSFELMNPHYIHNLGQSMSQVGVLHENARTSRRFQRISAEINQSQVNVVRQY